MKWITGILIALVAVCAVLVGGFLLVGLMVHPAWMLGLQVQRDPEVWRLLPREGFPRDGVPWDDMPMRPFRAYPGRIMPAMLPFGGFFGGLLCLSFLALIGLGIAALVLALTRSRRLAATAVPQEAPAPLTSEPAEMASPARTCPSCQRPVQDDWSHCPYCGTSLTPME